MEKVKNTPPDLDTKFNNDYSAKVMFVIDDYEVSMEQCLFDGEIIKVFYVNGCIKREWLDEDVEENKRFAYTDLNPNPKFEGRTFLVKARVETILKEWIDREINKSICLIDDEGNTLYKYK